MLFRSQQVGPVAELFHRGHDPGLGLRVDAGIVVQGPGDSAHIHAGQLGHVFQGWNGISLLSRIDGSGIDRHCYLFTKTFAYD